MEALIHVLLTLSLFTTTCLGDDLVATITLGASANYFGSAVCGLFVHYYVSLTL